MLISVRLFGLHAIIFDIHFVNHHVAQERIFYKMRSTRARTTRPTGAPRM
jgi:hypothetical protein